MGVLVLSEKPVRYNDRTGVASGAEGVHAPNVSVSSLSLFSLGPFIFDFAFPKLKVLMEVDSWTCITPSVATERRRKHRYAEENGWDVVRLALDPNSKKERVLSDLSPAPYPERLGCERQMANDLCTLTATRVTDTALAVVKMRRFRASGDCKTYWTA